MVSWVYRAIAVFVHTRAISFSFIADCSGPQPRLVLNFRLFMFDTRYILAHSMPTTECCNYGVLRIRVSIFPTHNRFTFILLVRCRFPISSKMLFLLSRSVLGFHTVFWSISCIPHNVQYGSSMILQRSP